MTTTENSLEKLWKYWKGGKVRWWCHKRLVLLIDTFCCTTDLISILFLSRLSHKCTTIHKHHWRMFPTTKQSKILEFTQKANRRKVFRDGNFWFPSDFKRLHKETLKGKRVCFKRRADYVILIVYSHLNFNLLLFSRSSPYFSWFLWAFFFYFLLSVAFFQSLANWTQSCSTILDTIIIAHMLFAVWSHRNHIKWRKGEKIAASSREFAFRELFYDPGIGGREEWRKWEMQRMWRWLCLMCVWDKSDSHDAG